MRVLVMGSGGVGGYFGGILAKAGNEIVFTARGAHLDAMQKNGLTLIDRGETTLLKPVNAVRMPADAGGLTYALGFMAATALLHAVGIAAAMQVARLVGKYGKIVAQVAGGLFALGGVGVLAGWL